MNRNLTGFEIAVIGMAGRFPGAGDIKSFWDNLKNGVESIRFFSREELLEEGVEEAAINDPTYVRAHAYLENKEYFDSAFFNYRSDEAKMLDPQTRLLHECVWQAMEDAGYDLNTYKNRIGLFTGTTPNLNWLNYTTLVNRNGLIDEFSASLLRDAGMSNTRISYLLNLRGPSLSVYTACSTSLVAIHQACNSLLLGECTIAMAGGASVSNFSKRGYFYRDGMILSKDGHCRVFDAASSGTVGGEGVGLVVLKKLQHALADKDNILAVIKGTGINNDGNEKVGYTAPGVNGQIEAILMARKMAGIEPESISYIEAHGTGTKLGDPVEVGALQRAFGESKMKYCALGSVKSNIGHLDAAAGVAGFIKATLALKNREIPPSLHFTTLNPEINFDRTPFYVNATHKKWHNDKYPLRAGVSSFGIGGTNAHIILEEAPEQAVSSPGRASQLLVFSAKTATALEKNMENFRTYLEENDETELADIAYTLQIGRAAFSYRKMMVCHSKKDAIGQLALDRVGNNPPSKVDLVRSPVIFMFSGQGSQYVNMCYGLYKNESVFREEADRCFELAKKISGKDLASVVFMEEAPAEGHKIDDTEFTQPVLFILEYALARLLTSWGIKPDAMIGHSIGEYVAACLSGVFSLEDALTLVIKRGELMQQAPAGLMLSIVVPENELTPLLAGHSSISLAAVNSPSSCVVAGDETSIHNFRSLLESKGYKNKVIRTSHAFHSWMMDGILQKFDKVVAGVKIHRPQIPFVSNLSGKYVTGEELNAPDYWVRHLRQTVLFSKGTETLLKNDNAVFIEVGPGKALSTFVRSHPLRKREHKVINLVRHPEEREEDLYYMLSGIGELWLNGNQPDWNGFYSRESRRRVSLPTYAFDKIAYTGNVDAFKLIVNELQGVPQAFNKGIQHSIHGSGWRHSQSPDTATEQDRATPVLVVSGKESFGAFLAGSLRSSGQRIIEVRPGDSFRSLEEDVFTASLTSSGDWMALWNYIEQQKIDLHHIIYCTALTGSPEIKGYDDREEKLNDGYLGLSFLAKSIENSGHPGKKYLTVINNYLARVTSEDEIDPLKAPIHGPVQVIPLEMRNVKCKMIDIPYPFHNDAEWKDLLSGIINEVFFDDDEHFVAYRHKERWVPSYQVLSENEKLRSGLAIVKGGTYMITGGMGGMGLTIANDLMSRHGAHVIIVHRSDFPERSKWEEWLLANGTEDAVSKKIRQLMNMEDTGSRIELFRLDISVEKEVRDFFGQIQQQHPKINGLIWAAGEVDFGGIILNREKEDFLQYTLSKINGVLLFEKYMDFRSLDFIALFASIGNVIHQTKFGQVAYNAANKFLETYPGYATKKFGISAFTINWSDWLDVGMTFRTVMRQIKSNDVNLINSHIPYPITPKEGIDIFHACLQGKGSVFSIHKGSLSETIALHRKELADSREIRVDPLPSTGPAGKESGSTEERLIAIFSLFFDKADVRPEDDFFEMGGDSLKVLTIIYRIQKEFDVELSVKDIFSRSSIRELSMYIDLINLKMEEGKDEVEFSDYIVHRL